MLTNEASALHIENELASHGLIQTLKPITSSLFKNPYFVENLAEHSNDPFDTLYIDSHNVSHSFWKLYFDLFNLFIEEAAKHKMLNNRLQVLYDVERAMEFLFALEFSKVSDYEKISDKPGNMETFNAVFRGFEKMLEILKENKFKSKSPLRLHGFQYERDITDHIAVIYSQAVHHSGRLKADRWDIWWIQHNLIWTSITWQRTEIAEYIHFKLRRHIYDNVTEMDRSPNFLGAAYVRYCLNVLGFELRRPSAHDPNRRAWPLRVAVNHWVRRNYVRIVREAPGVAGAMLPPDVTYDAKRVALVRTKDDPITNARIEVLFPLKSFAGSS